MSFTYNILKNNVPKTELCGIPLAIDLFRETLQGTVFPASRGLFSLAFGGQRPLLAGKVRLHE